MHDLDPPWRLADEIEVNDLWSEIKDRHPGQTPQRRVRSRGEPRRWVALVVGLAIGGLAIVTSVIAFLGRSSPTTSTPLTLSGHVVDTLQVGRATSAAFGDGSVWVAVDAANPSDRAVIRIDPSTDQVVATIPTAVVPGWEVGGGGIVVAQGSVWVAGRDESGGAIVRIDTSTNLVSDTIRVDEGEVADVAADGSSVWALVRGNDHPELLRLDPSSDHVLATIPLNGGYGRYVFVSAGSVLAAVALPSGGPFDNGAVVRIDPSTNQVAGTFDLGTLPSVAVDDGTVWAVTDKGLVQIDPATDTPAGAPANVSCSGDALAVGNGGVWCFDPTRGRALTRFNPQDGRVDVVVDFKLSADGTALAMSPGTIWELNGEQVIRIDLS